MPTPYNLIASQLDAAALNAQSLAQISKKTSLNLEEAYAIQAISLSKRYERGDKKVGLKLGFTSKAKMEQMGVHDLIWGRLTSKMHIKNGGQIIKNNFIHPRAEPEIAFRLSKDVNLLLNASNYLNYIDGIAVAIEIIDSRYEDFKFSLEDVIADNCSSAAFVVGNWLPNTSKVQDLGIQLIVDGDAIHIGNSNAILGNPLESLFAASRLALQNGESLRAGDIILAGAATPAVYIKAGQRIHATASGLGIAKIEVL